ncbi:MAG: HupE/UreJ family protein [Geminicoccaceae bacterium]
MTTGYFRWIPWARVIGAMVGLLGLTSLASAHEIRPAYLQIDQIGPDRYDVLWRTPRLSGMRLPVVLRLPEGVTNVTEPVERPLPDSLLERRVIAAPGGLAGKRIEFVGLQATITEALVRTHTWDGSESTTIVRPSQPWLDVPARQGWIEVALSYLREGVAHILFGLDHLLFVAALMLIVRDWRTLVKTITAFTIAHSITLTLATLGWAALPIGLVEAMIALSILLVAGEAVRLERGEASWTSTWPWVVAFAFGLLHGFGFAGALVELGLPQSDVPLALLSFNVGVEIGQLIFIAVVLITVRSMVRLVPIPRRVFVASAYAIGIIAAFWSLERLDAVFL